MTKQIKIELPAEWKISKLGDACKIQMGQSPPSSTYNSHKEGLPFFQGKAEFTELYPEVKKWCSNPKRIAEENDILLSVRAPIGPVNIANQKCAIGRGLAALSFECYKYLFYYLKLSSSKLDELGTGSTFRAVSKNVLYEFPIPLVPLPEQHRIVAKIEEFFSELDKAVENLQTAKKQIKTYRQSVLKHAFDGKLTAEWRRSSEFKIPSSKEELAMAAEPGKTYETNGNLPEGWEYNELGEYIVKITAGKSIKCVEKTPHVSELGIVKVSSVSWGRFDEEESKTTERSKLNEKYIIKTGDCLFSRANTIELVGACVIVENIKRKLMLSDKILRFDFQDLNKKFVLYYLRSPNGRKNIESLATGNQDSMRNISQTNIKRIIIPICSIEEQSQIVTEIENRFTVAGKMEESIDKSLKQAETLRQSILKKAFEGRLVPQVEEETNNQ